MGALGHALLPAELAKGRVTSLYSGQLGIAYAACRVYQALGQPIPDWLVQMIDALAAAAPTVRSYDIIDGSAGAIVGMLELYRMSGREACLDGMRAHADALLRDKLDEPEGASWGSPSLSALRNQVGFAHGASGAAWSLMEAYTTLGDPRYLYVAERALDYEAQFFVESEANWPDLRNPVVHLLEDDEEFMTLCRSVLNGGSIPTHRETYSTTWCYGAPGMLPVRARVASLARDARHVAQFEKACIELRALADDPSAYCLCHGACGNADAVRSALRYRDDVALKHALATFADTLPTLYRAGRWRSGVLGGDFDPTLLVGVSGIGYCALQLADPAIPSVLFMGDGANITEPDQTDWRLSHDAALLDRAFPQSLQALRPASEDAAREFAREAPPEMPLLVHMRRALAAARENAPDADARASLDRATLAEQAWFEVLDTFNSPYDELTETLMRIALGDDWQRAPLQIASATRVLRAAAVNDVGTTEPGRTSGATLLFRTRTTPRRMVISAAQLELLDLFDSPTSVDAILNALPNEADDLPQQAGVRVGVVRTVEQFLHLGVLAPTPGFRADESLPGASSP